MFPMKTRTCQNSPKANRLDSAEYYEHGDSLRSRLHAEADKILKWKVSSEIQRQQQTLQLEEVKHLHSNKEKQLSELRQQYATALTQLTLERECNEQTLLTAQNTKSVVSIVEKHTIQLRESLHVNETRLALLQAQRHSLLEQITSAEKNFHELKESHESVVETLRQKIQSLQEQNEDLSARYDKNNEQFTSDVKNLEQHIQKKEEELHNMLLSLQEKELKLSQLTEQRESIKEELAKMSENFNNKNNDLEEKSAILFETEKNAAQCCQRLEQMTVEKTKLSELLERNKNKLKEVELHLAEEKRLLLESETERNQLLDKVKSKEREIETGLEEKRGLTNKLDEAHSNTNFVQEELNMCRSQFESQRVTIEFHKNEYNSYRAQIVETIDHLTLEITEKTNLIAGIEKELKLAKDSNSQQAIHLASAAEEIQNHQSTVEELKCKITSLEDAIDDYNVHLADRNTQLNECECKLATAKTEVDHYRTAVESLQQQNRTATEDIDCLRKQIGEKDDHIHILEEQLEKEAQNNAKLLEANEELTIENVKIITNMQEREKQLDEIISKQKNREESYNQMESELQQTKNKLEQTSNKLEEANKNAEASEEKLNNANEQFLSLVKEMEMSKTEKDELEGLLTEAKQKINDIHNEMLIEERNKLESEESYKKMTDSNASEVLLWKSKYNEAITNLELANAKSEEHAQLERKMQQEVDHLKQKISSKIGESSEETEKIKLQCENRIKQMTFLLDDYKKEGEIKVKEAQAEAEFYLKQFKQVEAEKRRLAGTLDKMKSIKCMESVQSSPKMSNVQSPSIASQRRTSRSSTPTGRPLTELTLPDSHHVLEHNSQLTMEPTGYQTPKRSITVNDGSGQPPPPRSILRTPRSPWIGKRRVIFKESTDEVASLASTASQQFSIDDEAMEAHFSSNKKQNVSSVVKQTRKAISTLQTARNKQKQARLLKKPDKINLHSSNRNALFDSVFDFK